MTRKLFNKIFVAGVILFGFFFSISLTAHAATLSFSPSSGTYSVGDTIPVQIIVSSSDQSANAVSGTVAFPVDKFKVTSLSKSNSVVDFWAADPSFSNTAGTIHFEGVILNPGFTGSKGIVLTAYLKVKVAGSGSLTYSSASVLANDGSGTDITKPSGKASFNLANAAPTIAPVSTPASTPSSVSTSTKNSTSTSVFSIAEVPRSDTTDPIINLTFSSQSKTPVDHYTVSVDDSAGIDVVEPSYTSVPLRPGTHNVIVKVVYVGGSSLAATTDVVVTPIPTPVIKYYTDTVREDGYLVVQGISLPNTVVEAFLKDQYGKVISQKVNVDEKGYFNILWSSKLSNGVYSLTLQATDVRGAKSLVSNESSVLIEQTLLVAWGLGIINYGAILIVFFVLLSGFAFWAVYLWYLLKKFRKNLNKKISQVDSNLHKSFTLLFKDVKEHIDSIEKAQSRRDLTEEESRFIKKMSGDLKDTETFMDRRIKDLGK